MTIKLVKSRKFSDDLIGNSMSIGDLEIVNHQGKRTISDLQFFDVLEADCVSRYELLEKLSGVEI